MTKLAIILLILFVGSQAAENGSPCPPVTEILPCSCSKQGVETVMVCDYHDGTLIESVFRLLSQKSFIIDKLQIKSTRLPTLPLEYFKNLIVRQVYIDGEQLKTVDELAFQKQESNLHSFEITRSQLGDIPLALRRLQKLQKLAIFNSEIASIRQSEFCSYTSKPNIREMSFRCNQISSVGYGAFSQVTNLEYLDLSFNKIKELQAGRLPRFTVMKLKGFAIAHNELRSVIGDMSNIPRSALIDMSSNTIEDISGSSLQLWIKKRFRVNLKGNPLSCSCDFKILSIVPFQQRSIYGRCSYPSRLTGRHLTLLDVQDFTECVNPWANKSKGLGFN